MNKSNIKITHFYTVLYLKPTRALPQMEVSTGNIFMRRPRLHSDTFATRQLLLTLPNPSLVIEAVIHLCPKPRQDNNRSWRGRGLYLVAALGFGHWKWTSVYQRRQSNQ